MRLSVVVTIVDGGETLERCLRALTSQDGSPSVDVIVPFDDSVTGISSIAATFPSLRFLPLGEIRTARPITSAAGQHELFDRRRAAGLRAATAEIVAILEDRGVPRPDWARTMIALHEQLPHAVIGGAIENGRNTARHWAVYFCDFGHYQRPLEAGPRDWISDVNIGYKRSVLQQIEPLWRDRYHETTVNWALQRAGATLFLAPDLVVDQMRGPLTLSGLIEERFASGRLFAFTRARELSLGRRIALTFLTPLLPFVLLGRHAYRHVSTRARVGSFLAASAYMFVLLSAWSLGEAVGYVTGEP